MGTRFGVAAFFVCSQVGPNSVFTTSAGIIAGGGGKSFRESEDSIF
jgi:hypothetical protein